MAFSAVLNVVDVRFDYDRTGRRVRAIDGVSLSLAPGERLGVIGPSGSGKSTLARLAVGLMVPDAGRVEFEGRPLRTLSAIERRRVRSRLTLMFQDSWGALDPRLDARTSIEAPLRVHRRWRPGAAEELADWVRLPRSLLDRRPPELSGGQRQRIALARALALRPKVLVLDEPLTGLDLPVSRELRARILQLQTELQIATLWITHDLTEAEAVAEQVVVMDAGRCVERGPVERVLRIPTSPMGRALVAAKRASI